MSLSQYVEMVLALAALVASLGFGAARLRALLVPGWSGAPARLAEAVLALAALVMVLQVLGVAGALSAPAVLAACGALGLAAAALRTQPAGPPPRGLSRRALWPNLATIAIAAVLVFAWAHPVLTSLHRGMGDGDTLWYHMPFAGRFAQDGSIGALQFGGPDYLSWFYPANCELIHSLGILIASDRDVLSPLISLAWLALALLAAWCIGRSFGAGPLSVAAVALVLGSHLIVEREPGAARTDVAGLAFLLAAGGVLVTEGSKPRPSVGAAALAALAAGLAIGTKLTLLPAVAVLSTGMVLGSRGRRWAIGGVWAICLLATGGFWYARNLVYAGNPLPWIKLGVGPISVAGAHPDPASTFRFSVLHYSNDPVVWRHYFLPGLEAAFGPLWSLVLALAATGALLSLIRGSRVQRVLGTAAAATAFAYVVNPMSAPGPEGAPGQFEANLRYLTPALALGLALLPTVLPVRGRIGALGFTALFGLLIVGFPPELGRRSLAGALLIMSIAIAWAVVPLLFARRRSGVAGAVAAVPLIVLIAVGWPAARDYVRDRYRARADSKLEAPHMDAAYRWARHVRGSRIATTSVLQYGLYGEDLSNRVRYLGVEGRGGTFTEAATCRQWRTTLDAGDFNYLVLAPEYEGENPSAPRAWVRSPNAHPVLRSGPTTVIRLSGPLSPSGCGSKVLAAASRR